MKIIAYLGCSAENFVIRSGRGVVIMATTTRLGTTPGAVVRAPSCRHIAQRRAVIAKSSDRGPGFGTGFVLGGLVFGTLGVLFAPQVRSVFCPAIRGPGTHALQGDLLSI